MPSLIEIPFRWLAGYYPSSATLPPPELENTIRDGNNVWLRSMNRIEVANGLAQTSATNVGARIFPFNTQRATIAGGYVSSRLPNAGLMRYQNATMFFLSELTSQQVYLDETAVTGLTTSATAGMLRVGIPGSPWAVYDCGFDPPVLPSGDVSTDNSGMKSMTGSTGVALAAWRTKTNAVSAPSNIVYKALDGSTANKILTVLPTMATGQDGWVLLGTNWGDQSGNLRAVRYIYTTIRGTFTATNGDPNLTAGADTFFLRDLRPGDVVTISGGSYTISSVTDNSTAVLTGNFTGSTGSGKTATITTAAGDWRNGELGSLASYEVAKPVKAAGLAQYAGRLFLWGCYGENSSSVTGPAIVPLLTNNPEHINPTFAILTSNGDDLLNVLSGETRLFLLTANTIESATFTASDVEPYKVRILHQPGIVALGNAVVYKDQLYAYSGRPVRTVADDNMDTSFGSPVSKKMDSWTASRVTLHVDPIKQAVMYAHYDGSATTTILPYMAGLGVWGPPLTVTGQVVDSAVVNGALYLTLLSGGNYRVQTWEGGTAGSASTPWFALQFQDFGTMARKVMKALIATGRISSVRPYVVRAGGTVPDVSSTGAAVATITLSGTEKSEKEISTHINDFRALALRVDLPTAGHCDALSVRGYVKEAGR